MNGILVRGAFALFLVLVVATSAVGGRSGPARYEIAQRTGSRSWESINESQGFELRFTDRDVRIVPDAGRDPAWEWSLSLSRYGRPEALSAAAAAPLSIEGHRARRPRPDIEEWFVNDERGLEHGFTLARAPRRTAHGSTDVFIEMALEGSLHPRFSPDGQAVDFWTPEGDYALRYAQLEVVDACGRRLDARMEGFFEPGVRGIRIRFDDENACYPVTVDPLTTTAAWTAEGNRDEAYFGGRVSTAGDVNGDGYSDVLVSDTGDFNEGRVYLYLGSASGLATTPAWTAEGNVDFGAFGGSMGAGDVNGDGYDDIVIGNSGWSDDGELLEGRVLVYHGSPAGLSANPSWQVEGDLFGVELGVSAAMAGDVNGDGYDDVIVGQSDFDFLFQYRGRARVYLGSAAGLALTPAWTATGDQNGARFAANVAGAGDINADGYADVILSEPLYYSLTQNVGRILVYLGSASGLSSTPAWTQVGTAAGALGSVSTAGDVNGDGYSDFIIGSSNFANGQAGEGAVFVYYGGASPASWTLGFQFEGNAPSPPGFTTGVGGNISTAGDVNGDGYADIWIGAAFFDSQATDGGKAFLFLGSASGLIATAVNPDGFQAGANLGGFVAAAGDVNGDGFSDYIAGAPGYDNGNTNEGRAFLYLGSGQFVKQPYSWTWQGSSALTSYFGRTIRAAGDVNGDGYGDVIAGQLDFANDYAYAGRAEVFTGSRQSGILSLAWSVEGQQDFEQLGASVDSAGDINGDGYSDVVIGSSAYSPNLGAEFAGKVSMYLGSATGLAAAPAWTDEGSVLHEFLGEVVAGAGDVNGDGLGDFLAFAGTGTRLYFGSPSGSPIKSPWIGPPISPSPFGGRESVASAGDVNRDGYSDVILGSPGDANGSGKAFLFLGSPSGLSSTPDWTAQPSTATPGADFGAAVASAGDVNGDGYSDVVIGAPRDINSVWGKIFVYLGSSAGLSTTPAFSMVGGALVGHIGHAVGSAGDLDLDGYGDFVVGAPLSSNEGKVLVFRGGASGPNLLFQLNGTNHFGSRSGWCVGSAGDVNGDAMPDLLVGAPGSNVDNIGRAYVYLGNEGMAGVDRRPGQRAISGTAPIALLGKSDSENAFRLSERGFSPAGRGPIRLEWEVKPLGIGFNGSGLGSTPLADTGAPGPSGSVATYDELAGLLAEGTRYHWRTRIASSNPLFPRSPWKSISGNTITETKLRTAGCVDPDHDGAGDLPDPSCDIEVVDCLGTQPDVWATPGPTSGMLFTSKTTLVWSPPEFPGVANVLSLRYDTLRSADPTLFSTCVESNDLGTTAVDGTVPASGQVFFYLSRARNSCPSGVGSLGTTSAGAERVGVSCP